MKHANRWRKQSEREINMWVLQFFFYCAITGWDKRPVSVTKIHQGKIRSPILPGRAVLFGSRESSHQHSRNLVLKCTFFYCWSHVKWWNISGPRRALRQAYANELCKSQGCMDRNTYPLSSKKDPYIRLPLTATNGAIKMHTPQASSTFNEGGPARGGDRKEADT